MNPRQLAFYVQARSDWTIFQLLRSRRVVQQRWWWRAGRVIFTAGRVMMSPCHELHYLRMCSEKFAKAYFRTPVRTHAAFRSFLMSLPNNQGAVKPLGFQSQTDLIRWVGSVTTIVGAVEDLAPASADRNGLPNPEYPWPRGAETSPPANYPFQIEIYDLLEQQSRSGEPDFLTVLDRMVATMQSDAWHL